MAEDDPLSGVTGILKETADERLLIVSIELIWCFVRIFPGGRWEREISLKYVRFGQDP